VINCFNKNKDASDFSFLQQFYFLQDLYFLQENQCILLNVDFFYEITVNVNDVNCLSMFDCLDIWMKIPICRQ